MLRNIIIDLQRSVTWKIQLTLAVNFIFSKDTDKELVMHSKTDNIEGVTYDGLEEVIKELFESLLCRYEIGLETLMF